MNSINYYEPDVPQRLDDPWLHVTHAGRTYVPHLVRIRKQHFTADMIRALDLTHHAHSHRIYHLVFYLDGTNTILIGDRQVRVSAGQMVLIDPDIHHNVIPREPEECTFMTLMFTYQDGRQGLSLPFGRLLERLLGERLVTDTAVSDTGGALRAFFSYLEKDVLESGEKDLKRVGFCLAGILNEVYGLHLRRERARAIPDDVRAVQDFILNNMEQRITINDLTGVSHLSRSRLIGKFKQYCGMSPVDFLIHQRIEKAKTYLQHSTKRVMEIAWLCGFRSEYYFCKTFKARVRLTPGQFRNGGAALQYSSD